MIKHPVGFTILNSGHFRLIRQTKIILNHIRVAIGLRLLAPNLEVRIAAHRHARIRIVGRDVIGARSGNGGGADIGRWRIGRQDRGMWQGQLVKKFGIRAGQVDGHSACRLITHNAAFKGASCRLCKAGICPHDHRIESARRRTGHFENALKRRDYILDAQFLPVREHDAFANFERVSLAVIGNLGHRLGNIWDLLKTFGSGSFFEGQQTIIKPLINLPVLQRIVDMRINRTCGRPCNKPHRAAAVFFHILCLRRG